MIYKRVKELAEERKLSIYRIERETELSNGTIAKWKYQTPTVSNLSRVAKYLNVTIEDLMN